ncbi:MAG: 50S ribosomal protein L18 [Patescibacteria group bacterium]
MENQKQKRIRRHKRARSRFYGTGERPRLSVFRSNRSIYAQIINDEKGSTIVGLSDASVKNSKKQNKSERAREAGRMIAEKAKEAKIKKVVYDRGGYKYHGRVKALAEGAREGGLEF